MTKFVAIDFETANADLASVCQIGIALFEDRRLTELWGTLVNPEDDFSLMNISVHGIDESMVSDSPTFQQVYEKVVEKLSDAVVVSHTHFDRAVLAQVIRKYGLPDVHCVWLDSAMVVRRTWNQWARSGYGLTNVCHELGIIYKAHDAIEDARAAGEVLIKAMSETGHDLNGLIARVKQPLMLTPNGKPIPIATKGNPDGPLAGQELVFTGSLTIPRREAATIAAKIGCDVADNIKKTTTLLVVGDQDILKLAGHDKSSKHRKAEELIAKGHSIRILRESDFMRLAELS